MGRVIAATVLTLLALAGALWAFYRLGKIVKREEYERAGFLNSDSVKLLHDAAVIFGRLGVVSSLDEVEILRPENRDAIDKWRDRYLKAVTRKVAR